VEVIELFRWHDQRLLAAAAALRKDRVSDADSDADPNDPVEALKVFEI
jgi:hypothetical protein